MVKISSTEKRKYLDSEDTEKENHSPQPGETPKLSPKVMKTCPLTIYSRAATPRRGSGWGGGCARTQDRGEQGLGRDRPGVSSRALGRAAHHHIIITQEMGMRSEAVGRGLWVYFFPWDGWPTSPGQGELPEAP